jgi:hypothetical protein
MKHLLPVLHQVRQRARAHQFEAIALLSLLALGGVVLRPGWSSNVPDPELPANVRPEQQATSTARQGHRQNQMRQIRPENFDLKVFPVQERFEKHWKNLLWTTAVVEPQETYVADAVEQILALSTRKGLSNSQMRTVDMAMKVATQLYISHPGFYQTLGQRFLDTVERSPDPEWAAVALSGLANSGLSSVEQKRLSDRVKQRFPNWASNVYLRTTLQEVSDAVSPPILPPLADLLKWQVAAKQVHVYVLCRSDRRILCRAFLKNRDGEFVTQGDRLWSMPLLLESIHGLGWNFTRGQTPQGIYRIEGVVPQAETEFFRAYGQFDLINLYVPFEPGAKQFIPGQGGAFTGNLTAYQGLLPNSWRGYRPMQQSYWAGKSGRALFRIHGSGESPDFFNGKDPNYPDSFEWNPTIGCFSARELYNEQGKLLQADMPKLLNALRMVGGPNFAGYAIVVDVPSDSKQAVSVKDVESILFASAKGKPGRGKATLAQNAKLKPNAKPKPTAPRATPSPIANPGAKPKPIALQDRAATAAKPKQTEAIAKKEIEAPTKSPDAKPSESLAPLPIAY